MKYFLYFEVFTAQATFNYSIICIVSEFTNPLWSRFLRSFVRIISFASIELSLPTTVEIDANRSRRRATNNIKKKNRRRERPRLVNTEPFAVFFLHRSPQAWRWRYTRSRRAGFYRIFSIQNLRASCRSYRVRCRTWISPGSPARRSIITTFIDWSRTTSLSWRPRPSRLRRKAGCPRDRKVKDGFSSTIRKQARTA